MEKSVPIRVSRELRDSLGDMKCHKDESYDMLLKRKLKWNRERKETLKKKISYPRFTPTKATNKVLNSDKKVTKEVLR